MSSKTPPRAVPERARDIAALARRLASEGTLQEDRRDLMRDSPVRRDNGRVGLVSSGFLRPAGRGSVPVAVHDLSIGGCCISGCFYALRSGDAVWFRLDGFEAWAGTVRWSNRERTGIAFDRPLHPAVFAHLRSGSVVQCGPARPRPQRAV